jgi:hypothetical protein
MTDAQDDQSATSPVQEAVERAVELFVYAPIGLLFEGASILPQLVEKGKAQVGMARMVGRFAVGQGRSEAGELAEQVGAQAAGLLARFGQSLDAHPPLGPSAPEGAEMSPPASAPAAPPAAEVTSTPAAASANGSGERIDPATLAIPDYDGLSASHVVNRLAGLSAAELDAVRRYEAANRGRKTILSKIAQLQAG